MLIKFKAPDPRAGTTARMDSSRGQQLVDAGAADQVDEATAGQADAAAASPPAPAKPAAKRAQRKSGTS